MTDQAVGPHGQAGGNRRGRAVSRERRGRVRHRLGSMIDGGWSGGEDVATRRTPCRARRRANVRPALQRIPEFERETGFGVEVVARLPHPELNAFIKRTFEPGAADIDLLSTHTKYAPSQAQWLTPLEDPGACDDSFSRPPSCRVSTGSCFRRGILDVRLLHYQGPKKVPERPPRTRGVISRTPRPTRAGRARVSVSGSRLGTVRDVLRADRQPVESSSMPLCVLHSNQRRRGPRGDIADLHHVRRVTPRALPKWHYDEISAAFRAGRAAMVCDWPGSHHLYKTRSYPPSWDRSACPPARRGNRRTPDATRLPYRAAARTPRARRCSSISRRSTRSSARRGAAQSRARERARPSPRRGARRSAEASSWELLAETEKMMIIPPRFAAYPRCEDAIWQAIQQAMVGTWPLKEAVARAARRLSIVDAHASVPDPRQ